ncbi:family A G protein-coupled receptor-like protein [Conidiobolus coronatus NRRL 28638]|uniref:Family A G protein-coupled receptor-like protein n=1 Tax=Conidiobolus coronatus (strain ATCC 28846 / CBS 209.66 / NRRL 28638) TaxID=796925 RepID=A0A137NYD3_CONC2|nr:family A G protein-coupled receptor-like protein [Conidiobolus coronatus NRRL 28638]|eukprot:KXN67688.1 family A G protein-coupled receptor-like protein [Conidiobolus coronatus NRRL 28638]
MITDPEYTFILSIINLFIGLLGIVVISLILISTRSILKENSTTNLRLVIIVLIVDFITCWTLLLGGLSTAIKPDFFFEFPKICVLGHFIAGGSTFCSIWFLALISFERFCLICLDYKVSNSVWYTMIASLLSLYCGMGIYSLFKNSIEPVTLGVYCFVSPEHSEGLIILFMVCILNCISLLTVLISYLGIGYITLSFTKQQYKFSENKREFTQFKKTLYLAFIKIFLIVTFYLITNSFETYLELLELIKKSNRSHKADLIAAALTNSNPLVNALLLLLINKDVGVKFLERFAGIRGNRSSRNSPIF